MAGISIEIDTDPQTHLCILHNIYGTYLIYPPGRKKFTLVMEISKKDTLLTTIKNRLALHKMRQLLFAL